VIIELKQLTKKFKEFTAVDSLTLTIEKGEAFALLGPNGAGKTTVVKMLTTLLPPTSGDASIGGFSIITDANKVRGTVGYVPQMLSVDGTLTGYENLMLFAKLYDIPSKERKQRVHDTLEFMGLTEASVKAVKTYSGGMIRRLEIAQSIVHRPQVLFLDEPTTGLDPIARKVVWEHLAELKKQYDTTILLTTHMMEEADNLCSRVAFMSRGKLVAMGAPEFLKNSLHKENASLEDAFIHYTSETLESSDNFRSISRDRKTEQRVG